MRIFLILLSLALGLGTLSAKADEVACLTSINGLKRTLVYDPQEPNVRANISLRERTFGGPEGIECPGFITLNAILRDLNPAVTYGEMEPFCLQYDAAQRTYLGVAVGPRNTRLICKARGKTMCQYVNDTKDAGLAVAGLGKQVLNGLDTAATAAGVTAAAAGSGATIISGPAAYLSGTFSSLGASALAVLTAPATLTATAVTVVVVGGAVYACSE
ncbi:MAG: hypothetical protein DI533_13320 [Cereibacter sphaeroides]|uniref:Uncharacterized protein n=1 Tax=Cereibacter sphaeroides TaxID=1063 RepID=A0A2W5S914_CERSP|nr:MAG: hypothetical protein DI533_13320 [Cereibacter sphaeroides]